MATAAAGTHRIAQRSGLAIAILVFVDPSTIAGSGSGTPNENTTLANVYQELRRLAAFQLSRERRNHTLQATALVHEAYLRLTEQNSPWSDRVHFIAQASLMMRRVLVDYARAHLRDKRGGGWEKVSLSEAAELRNGRTVEVLDLDCALGELAKVDARKAKLVELRYFGGLTMEESAQALGTSLATAERDWKFSRAFLLRELGG
jgi:RNA polymerase sigma factor (TIGR02999 family)